MADATQLPLINKFQWSRPDAENPRLATPISASATTIVVTNAALDEDGSAITGSFLMGIKDENGYTESVWVPAGSSADGITFTSCVRGIDLSGLDNTTNNTASLAVSHKAGDPVFCQIAGVTDAQIVAAIKGTIATGGNNFQIGDLTASDKTITFATDATVKPKIYVDDSAGSLLKGNRGDDEGAAGDYSIGRPRLTTAERDALTGLLGGEIIYNTDDSVLNQYIGGAWGTMASGTTPNASETVAGKVEIATNAEMGAGTSTGGSGAKLIPPNDQLVKTSSGAGDENKIAVLDSSGQFAVGFMTTNLQEANTFFGLTDATGTEMETLTDGSDASSLHNHDTQTNITSGVDSFSPSSGADTKAITHGLGRTPKLIRITWGQSVSFNSFEYNHGTYIYNVDTDTASAITAHSTGNPGVTFQNDNLAFELQTTSGTALWSGKIVAASVNSTTFTITIDAYTSGRSIEFTWECY